jgi:ornithine cyclodeaminase
MALIVSEEQTRKLIDMPRALTVVEKIFHDRAAGKVRSVPRRRLKSSRKRLNMMAAWHADSDLLCLRAYAGGANTIQAVLNAGYLSSLRTGAASGVAAKYLAPPRTEVLGLIGPGWQATFQVEAIMHTCPIRQVLVYGRNSKKRVKFIKQMVRTVPARFSECSSVEELQEKSDILVLATDSTSPLIDGNRLKDKVLIITMGANQPVKHEVSLDLIRRMDLVVTDDLPTARSDSGDLIAACEAGILRWEDIVPLERIVADGRLGNRPTKILFQSNGIPDEDLAVGRYVLNQVRRKKVRARSVPEI